MSLGQLLPGVKVGSSIRSARTLPADPPPRGPRLSAADICLLLAWMAGQGDTGEGGAVLVVPDVAADRVVLGAAALDCFDVDALIVRVGRDNLDLMCWGRLAVPYSPGRCRVPRLRG